MMNVRTGETLDPTEALSSKFPYPEDPDPLAPFPRIAPEFSDKSFALHRVTASDIDNAGHMNNIAQIRAMLNVFGTEEWQGLKIHDLSIVFLASVVEGDTIAFRRRTCGKKIDLRGSRSDGRTILLAELA